MMRIIILIMEQIHFSDYQDEETNTKKELVYANELIIYYVHQISVIYDYILIYFHMSCLPGAVINKRC